MRYNCSVQRLVCPSWQRKYSAVREIYVGFRHAADVGEIDDHSSSYSCKAVIKELFKLSESALYRVFSLGVNSHVVLVNVEVFDLVQRNTHHLTRQGKIEATLVLNELFAGSVKNGV